MEEIVVSVVSTPFLSGGANRRLGCSIAASGSREKNIAGRMSRDLRLPDPLQTWIGRIIAIASWAHNLLARMGLSEVRCTVPRMVGDAEGVAVVNRR